MAGSFAHHACANIKSVLHGCCMRHIHLTRVSGIHWNRIPADATNNVHLLFSVTVILELKENVSYLSVSVAMEPILLQMQQTK